MAMITITTSMSTSTTKTATTSRPMRLIFMGTPSFAVPALAGLREAGHDVVAVYTQPPRPAGRGQKDRPSAVHDYAQAHNIPVFTPTSLKSPEVQAEFAAHKADAAIVAAYGLLLPQAILDACPRGCINIHPSLLPRWRGAAPIQRTIMAGDTKTAIVIMQMDAGLDTGDMLSVEHVLVPDSMNAGELHDLLAQHSAALLLRTLDKLDRITQVKQPTEGITYAAKITKEESRIDWTLPARDIQCLIRGLSPSPGATFHYDNETIKIYAADIEPGNHPPGPVIDDKLAIACGAGILRPTILQRPGKKRMSADELLNSFSIPIGTVLD